MHCALRFLAVFALASSTLIVHAQDPLPATATMYAASDAPLPHVPLLEAMPQGDIDMKLANTSARIMHFAFSTQEGVQTVSIAPLSEHEFKGADEIKAAKDILATTFKPFVDRGELVVGGLRAVQAPPPSPLPAVVEGDSDAAAGAAEASSSSETTDPGTAPPERRRR